MEVHDIHALHPQRFQRRNDTGADFGEGVRARVPGCYFRADGEGGGSGESAEEGFTGAGGADGVGAGGVEGGDGVGVQEGEDGQGGCRRGEFGLGGSGAEGGGAEDDGGPGGEGGHG